MAQEAEPQQQQGLGADFWWRLILGFMLLILNTAFYFAFPLAKYLGWSVLTAENSFLQWLLYLLFCFLGFFLIGWLRGRGTWTARAAKRLCVTVGLIGILPVIVVSVIIGLVLLVLGSLEGGIALADAISLAPLLGGSEILAGIAGVQGGRLIGNRLLHGRSDPM